jgi:hypothetical protein
MEDVEQRALASVPVSLSFWKRFVNDVISAVSINEIDILLQHLNSIEPSVVMVTKYSIKKRGCGNFFFYYRLVLGEMVFLCKKL